MARRIPVVFSLACALAAGASGDDARANSPTAQHAAPPIAAPSVPAATAARRQSTIHADVPDASVECKVKSPSYEGRSSLRFVRRALLQKRPVRVIALGSSSTVGVGASSPLASYPVRLENDLEGVIEGLSVEMFPRGLSGEIAEGAAERLKTEVAALQPDLIVWQVGTNDAVARIDREDFGEQLRETLGWLASHEIDVVLIDPQYVERLSKDARYVSIVNEIATVASEMRVMLVNRFDSMADLARRHPGASYLSSDRFHLNDLGYRCMAEYAARAIVSGVLQADAENGAGH
jgi:acyl-CoA thioesterase I